MFFVFLLFVLLYLLPLLIERRVAALRLLIIEGHVADGDNHLFDLALDILEFCQLSRHLLDVADGLTG